MRSDAFRGRGRPATGIYLGLGSNLGEPESNLRLAIEGIESLGLRTVRSSSIYLTEPVGRADQPWFLNQVIEVATDSPGQPPPPGELLESLLAIEARMGRERSIAGGARVIDIDILLHGDEIVESSPGKDRSRVHIVVPHPRMHLRRFVLEPMAELAPDLIHPVLKKTVGQLLESLGDQSAVHKFRNTSRSGR